MKLSRLLLLIVEALVKHGDVEVRISSRGDCPDVGGVRFAKGTLFLEDVWTVDKRRVNCSDNDEGGKES